MLWRLNKISCCTKGHRDKDTTAISFFLRYHYTVTLEYIDFCSCPLLLCVQLLLSTTLEGLHVALFLAFSYCNLFTSCKTIKPPKSYLSQESTFIFPSITLHLLPTLLHLPPIPFLMQEWLWSEENWYFISSFEEPGGLSAPGCPTAKHSIQMPNYK